MKGTLWMSIFAVALAVSMPGWGQQGPPLSEELKAIALDANGFQPLLADDLSNVRMAREGWSLKDGVLSSNEKGDLWTKERYANFVLDLEFKVVKGCNSGIFIRTDNRRNCVHTGIEIQVLDSHGKPKVGKHDCGAIYDIMAPKVNAAKKAGEWNRITITAQVITTSTIASITARVRGTTATSTGPCRPRRPRGRIRSRRAPARSSAASGPTRATARAATATPGAATGRPAAC